MFEGDVEPHREFPGSMMGCGLHRFSANKELPVGTKKRTSTYLFQLIQGLIDIIGLPLEGDEVSGLMLNIEDGDLIDVDRDDFFFVIDQNAG